MTSPEFSLEGKVALVAGDGRFWGRYIASALAEAGADVAIAAKSAAEAKAAAEEVRRHRKKALQLATELTNAAKVRQMVEQVVAHFDKIDILVNCADLELAKPFLETTEEEWHRVLQVNLTSAFLCCQEAGRQMLKQKGGKIINLSSGLAERGLVHGAAYCVAKGGVLQLTRALALEWARANIRVNAVGPLWIREDAFELQGDSLSHFIPLKRYGHPAELGSLVVYLACDASNYVTGQLFYMDGGALAHA